MGACRFGRDALRVHDESDGDGGFQFEALARSTIADRPAGLTLSVLHMLLVLFLLASPGGARAQTPARVARSIPLGTVQVVRDLPYAQYGGRTLLLDLYRPADSVTVRRAPVVVIRGGGWQQGDKLGFAPAAAALAERGFVAVSIEYRTSNEAPFPAAVHDTKAAVRWLRANAAVYGLDPERIGAIGGSAGGHLAVYLGVTAGIKSLEGEGGSAAMDSRVEAVVAMGAPADLATLREMPAAQHFVGVPLEADPDRWRFASPITHVDAGDPPLLLLHSEADPVVPFEEAITYASRYGEVGIPVEMVLYPDAPHPFWAYSDWFDDAMDRAADFFRRHLFPESRR